MALRTALRFHFHDPVLFRLLPQTSVVNQVVLKGKARSFIPQTQEEPLQERFEEIIRTDLFKAQDDKGITQMLMRVYKPFMSPPDLKRFLGSYANVNQIRIFLNGNLRMRRDSLHLLRSLTRNGAEFGIVRSNYLRSLGLLDHHYIKAMMNIAKRSNVSLDGGYFSDIISPVDNFVNEEVLQEHLARFKKDGSHEYLVINSPESAEALTSLAFKLGMKIILVTDPFFEKPSSTLSDLLHQFQVAKQSQDHSLCRKIYQEIVSMDQLTVKDLSEVQELMATLGNGVEIKATEDNSFWNRLEQMEISILGDLESRHRPMTA